MSAHNGLQNISCGRCQSKKVRCNRVTPQCDKCQATNSECIYLPRKSRPKKIWNDSISPGHLNSSLLSEVLGRLDRLEEHCSLTNAPEAHGARDNFSFNPSSDIPHWQSLIPPEITNSIGHVKDEPCRSLLLSAIFCQLGQIDSCFFSDASVREITFAISEVESRQSLQNTEPLESLIISKDLARMLIEKYYDSHQFAGFKYPLEKSFLLSIPDLIENLHVQLDYTSQIIYYSVLLRGIMLDPAAQPNRGNIIRALHLKCLALSDEWIENIQDTYADLLAASLLTSIAMEACNIDLAWKAFGHVCRISKALGYFSVDETSNESMGDGHIPPSAGEPLQEEEVERNRKRFGFWHILRTDCLFRISFGKPTLIPAESWKVNFPDLTITGVDDEKSHFIQIHFLASMRLTLTVMRYLDWVARGPITDSYSHDIIIDGYISEVQSILMDWDEDTLPQLATQDIDIWLCVDVLFSSYKMLIVLYLSKKCDRSDNLPRQAVDMAKKSIGIFQSLFDSLSHKFWGISVVLIHQCLPFFVLCLDILGNPDRENTEKDILSMNRISDYVEMVIGQRIELTPIVTMMKAIATACQRTKMGLTAD